MIILDAALGPHEALDRARYHEKMGPTIRGIVLNDLLRRNPGPGIIEPSIPDVVWISVATKVHLELRLHTSAAPQQNSDLGSAVRYGCASLSGRWRLSNHSLCGPSCARPVVQSTRVIAVVKSADQVARAITLCISASSPMERAANNKGRLLATGVI